MSIFSKILLSFLWSNKLYRVRLMGFVSAVFSLVIPFPQPHKSDGMGTILSNFNRDCLWNKCGFIILIRISKFVKKLLILKVVSFSSSYEIFHSKHVNVLTYSNIRLIYYNFASDWNVSFKFLTFDFSRNISIPNSLGVKCKVYSHRLWDAIFFTVTTKVPDWTIF
jgi:hypothetical protein